MSELRKAAQEALDALDGNLYINDYCGLECNKHGAGKLTEAIEALRAALAEPDNWNEVDSLRADAARYRWLLSAEGAHDTFTAAYFNTFTTEDFDAAIDASMKP